MGNPSSTRPFLPGTLLALVLVLLIPFARIRAGARPSEPLGGKGQLAIDTLMGFRIGAFSGVFRMHGPLGFSTQSYNEHNTANNDLEDDDPSDDVLVCPGSRLFHHRSPVHRRSSRSRQRRAVRSKPRPPTAMARRRTDTDRPTTTAFTFLPRVGVHVPDHQPLRHLAARRNRVRIPARRARDGQKYVLVAHLLGRRSLHLPHQRDVLRERRPRVDLLRRRKTTRWTSTINPSPADASFFQFGLATGLGILLDL